MTPKDEIQAAEDKLAVAVALRNSTEVIANYTEDARLMPNGAPTLVGRAQIAAFFDAAFAQGIVAGKFTALEVEECGDTATEIGAYELFAQPPEGPRVSAEKGRYFVQWRRLGGNWLLHRDMFNQDKAVS